MFWLLKKATKTFNFVRTFLLVKDIRNLRVSLRNVAIGIEILFFRVLVTIEPGRSLLQFVTTNYLTTKVQSLFKR